MPGERIVVGLMNVTLKLFAGLTMHNTLKQPCMLDQALFDQGNR